MLATSSREVVPVDSAEAQRLILPECRDGSFPHAGASSDPVDPLQSGTRRQLPLSGALAIACTDADAHTRIGGREIATPFLRLQTLCVTSIANCVSNGA